MLQALRDPAQFRWVMGTSPLARHGRWVLHGRPASPPLDLSTGSAPVSTRHVDDPQVPSVRSAPAAPRLDGCARLGCVLPKRHARRAVTRSLVRRLARREAAHAQSTAGEPAWWVLRLVGPIPAAEFPSARSEALRRVLSAELEACFAAAAQALARLSRRSR